MQGTLTLDRPELILEAARSAAGLAYLSEWDIADDLAAGRLQSVLEDWTPLIDLIREKRDQVAAKAPLRRQRRARS